MCFIFKTKCLLFNSIISVNQFITRYDRVLVFLINETTKSRTPKSPAKFHLNLHGKDRTEYNFCNLTDHTYLQL